MSTTSPIPQTIEILSREKNIDPNVIISAMEDAVVAAARKQFKTGEDLHARYNHETGTVELFALMTVVDEVTDPATEISLAEVEEMGVEGAEAGDQLEFPRPTEELGRIAAQTAKQIIFQKVREAERNNVYDEYIGRVGELVHGFVKRFEGGRIITDLGKIEAVLPKTQQSRAESFAQGERIRIVINSVSKDAKGPQVEVSRTSPELLKRLFEMEVPEIYDGTVQIKAAVREPGDRAKIAVISTERDVDPVGACVGMKGSRVQAIIRELRGERIDIIEWSEDPAVFAANALSPAKVSKVEINSFEEKKLTVTVPEDQLSLAIGKKGQNVRLAAKLVGWHIDIRSAEEAARAAAAQLEAVMAGGEATLTDIRESLALDQITAERLKDRGIETIEQLGNVSVDELVDMIDVSFDQANEILERAGRLLAQKHAREEKMAREAQETVEQPAEIEGAEEAAADAQAGHAVSVSEEGVEGAEDIAIEGAAESIPAEETGEAAELAPGAESEELAGLSDEPEEEQKAETEETPGGPVVEMAGRQVPIAEAYEGVAGDEQEEARARADERDEEREYAPPPDAEPDPSRPTASAVPDFDAMSPSEAQIQEAAAEIESGMSEREGPMPQSGLEAFAPGERVVAESHSEWMAEAGIADSPERTVEQLVETFDTPPAEAEASSEEEPTRLGQTVDDAGVIAEAGAPTALSSNDPSDVAEEETESETSDELPTAAFEGEEGGEEGEVKEGGEDKL